LLLVFTTAAGAQVLLPEEVKDVNARTLQQKYMPQLRTIGNELEVHRFPYHFYFSRVLDIEEERQLKADQRSIRFDKFQGHTVLAISGNYFAAYSGEMMGKNERVKKTMEDVVIPILQSAVPVFAADDSFVSFAIEISHHVRRKVMGMSAENPENMMFVLPRAAAQHMVAATNPERVQAALLDSEVYVDAEPFDLWVNGKRPSDEEIEKIREDKGQRQHGTTPGRNVSALPVSADITVSEKLVKAEPMNRLVLPQTLANLQLSYADPIARLLDGIKDQAHWVSFAPPSFIGFHGGAYLQLSVESRLELATEASRYKRAALAFDDHIAHLVRPTLAYFPNASDFDGISFSTTVKQTSSPNPQAVEFYFSFKAMECFARYDCSGQDLINSGLVLINGERVTLNLDVAEGNK
jgi:hypothetical protein